MTRKSLHYLSSTALNLILPPAPQGRFPARRSRRGVAPLVQTVLAFVIVLIAIVGAYELYAGLRAQTADSNLVQEANRITSTIDQAYANTGTYDSGSLLAVLTASQNFPDKEIPSGGTVLYSPYQTTITVTGSGSTTYSVEYTSIPQSGCTMLLNNYSGRSNSSLQSISVNGTSVTVPPTPTSVATACDKDTGNDVTLTF